MKTVIGRVNQITQLVKDGLSNEAVMKNKLVKVEITELDSEFSDYVLDLAKKENLLGVKFR